MHGECSAADFNRMDESVSGTARLHALDHRRHRLVPRPFTHRFVDGPVRHQFNLPVMERGVNQDMRLRLGKPRACRRK